MNALIFLSPLLSDLITLSSGLLVLRLVIGLGLAAHGAQKLFGWFGGHGIAGTASFFEQLGFRPGRPFATAAAVTEFSSGLLVALGLLGPIGPALMISVMIVAMGSVHWSNGFFATDNGIETPFLYATAAFVLALIGPGNFSLDALLGIEWLREPAVVWSVLVIGVVGAAVNLAMRRSTQEPTSEQ